MSCCALIPCSPYSACYKTPKCDLFTPNWKYDPHRAHFCQKFGQDYTDICPEVCDPCESIHEPLRSLDYFSAPPMYRRSACQQKFRYKKGTFEPDPCACVGACKDCDPCPSLPQLPRCFCRPKPKPFGDVICGLCVDTEQLEQKLASMKPKPKEKVCRPRANSQFQIYGVDPSLLWPPPPRKPLSQVERCLHPSDIRYLASTSKSEYLDFWKLKSREHINLYRTRLAIDNRRPPITCPIDPNANDKIYNVNEPIIINAKVLRFRNQGNLPIQSYQVSVTPTKLRVKGGCPYLEPNIV